MAGLLEKYKAFFDYADGYPVVSLEEGNTPLVPAPSVSCQVSKLTGSSHFDIKVYLKYEGANPTGSFKDRGMTYAVSQAKADGAEYIICASTGNTSAAAAAYGTRAGLKTLIILPEGKVALGKLSQAILYGASIVEIDGNFDQALDIVREVGKYENVAIVNSINPYRIEGQKTGAFEVCDGLGKAPDYHFIPVGNAGNITAYWKGYKEYQAAGKIAQLPKMCGYQAEGSAAIVYNRVIEKPETFATAIRIGNPASWTGATDARDESGGWIDAVTDDDIAEAYTFLASKEGVFCEPASAASVAGVFKAAKNGQLQSGTTVVCVLTGNGLKDPDSAIRLGTPARTKLPADAGQVAAFFKL